MHIYFTWLADALVCAGMGILIWALLGVRRLVNQLPSGPLRKRWFAMTLMIALFLVGYFAYLVLRWDSHLSWVDLIVPVIFFFGACFVALTAALSLRTALDIVHIGQLERQAITDALTGAFNRRYMDQRLADEVASARRYGLPLSVLLLDIDHFKRVNDTHGHPIGDEILVGIKRLLAERLRDSDVLTRYGGEEFLIIATHTHAQSACDLADRMRRHIESHVFRVHGYAGKMAELHITVSIGVADLNESNSNAELLVRSADEQLYRAKTAGRNRVACASQVSPSTKPIPISL